MTWRVGSQPAQFEQAVAWFRQRVPMTPAQYAAASASAKRQAFTVAGVTQLDMVHDVWAALDSAIANGTTLDDFKAAIGGRLARVWGGDNPSRLETIFRTNVQSAYSAGRYAQISDPDIVQSRPYWMYDSVLDSRTSSLCKGLNGTVLPHDHEFWGSHIPPLHFRCRSGLRSLTTEQAQAKGITENPSEEAPSEGFGLPPSMLEWQPNPQKYPSELWDILEIQRMESSPRLSSDVLPKDRRIPKDALLRGASPEEVAGTVRAGYYDLFYKDVAQAIIDRR